MPSSSSRRGKPSKSSSSSQSFDESPAGLDATWIRLDVPRYAWSCEVDEDEQEYFLNAETDAEQDAPPQDWDEVLAEHSGTSQEVGVAAGQTVDDVLEACGLGPLDDGGGTAHDLEDDFGYALRPKTKALKRLGSAAAADPELGVPLVGPDVIVDAPFVVACRAADVTPAFELEKALASTRPTPVQFFLPGGGAPEILKIPAEHTLGDLKAELYARALEAVSGRKFAKLKNTTLKIAHLRAFALRGYSGETHLEADPTALVRESGIAIFCSRERLTMKLSLVEDKVDYARSSHVRESGIEKLVGYRTANYIAPEAQAFRRMHRALRMQRTADNLRAQKKKDNKKSKRSKSPHAKADEPTLDVPGPSEGLDLGEPAQHLKENRWFELSITFMSVDETGQYVDAGGSVVHLCDHAMTMRQLLEDVACDKLEAPHEWICKARGYDEWMVGDRTLIDYRYIRGRLEKRQPVFVQAMPRSEVIAREFKRIEQDSITEMELQKQVDLEDETKDEVPYDCRMDPSLGKADWTCLPIWHLTEKFTVKIIQATEIVLPIGESKKKSVGTGTDKGTVWVQMGMYHGGPKGVMDECFTAEQPANEIEAIAFQETLEASMATKVMPRATVLSFTLMHKASDDPAEVPRPVAWVNMHVFDHTGILVTGQHTLRMWPSMSDDDMANPIGTCVEDLEAPNPMLLTLEFEEHLGVFARLEIPRLPICKYTWGADNDTSAAGRRRQPNPDAQEAEELEKLCASDPLTQPDDEQKHLLYNFRHFLKDDPRALAKLMLAIDWMIPDQIREARRMLKQWAPLSPTQALDLLDARYADLPVREHAVDCLEGLSDTELELYMPQLIQTLKYDPYHNSALSGFLMRRALLNPSYIGHLFFWSLKAETHIVEIRERYSLLIDEFLRGCGLYRKQLTQQHNICKKLVTCAERIKPLKMDERLAVLRRDLEALNKELPQEFELPLDPKLKLSRLKVQKCRFMDSKKLPLWLVFENADPLGDDYYVMFKSGDDLRQDVLTLQMIRIMDRLWQSEGLDLKSEYIMQSPPNSVYRVMSEGLFVVTVSSYGCIATGDEEGLLEIVMNSDTMANISKDAGENRRGVGGKAAELQAELLDPSVFTVWLRGNNRSVEEFTAAVHKFVLSTAGYCVATYVLGIGDRHNDNVMLTRDGKCFHIDFGHFLGNFKSKYGFKRERAPFVFTPQYAHVMGGVGSAQYERFLDVAAHSYNIIRKHGHLLLALFTLMLSTGIPELRELEDIYYLRDMMSLELDTKEAAEKMETLIGECLHSKATKFNNFVHILAH